jgi:hypothetical protein
MMRKKSQIVRHIRTFIYIFILILLVNFIDDDTPIASGSGTQQHTSWNTLQNAENLDDFFAGIYERYRSHRMRPTTVEDTTSLHDCICSLPGDEEFPLWRIGCRVCLWLKFWNEMSKSLLDGPWGRGRLLPSPEIDQQTQDLISLYPWFSSRFNLCGRYFGL